MVSDSNVSILIFKYSKQYANLSRTSIEIENFILLQQNTFSLGVKCPNSCFGNGICMGISCLCNTGWSGKDCSVYDCKDVNNCSGFGECVGPNQCKCRGGWHVSI